MEKHIPKKSLGQHFLTSPQVISAMITCSDIATSDYIVEIGPGEGALTRELLNTGATIFAIEKDQNLLPILENTFREFYKKGKFVLEHADVLIFDTGRLPTGYKVIANIPYYITGAIIRYFLAEATKQPKLMTLLIQKEVAERILARDKKESLLSLSVKAYGIPKYIKTVSRGSFRPAPVVDSAIISIHDISKSNFQDREEEKIFFMLLHLGFGHKRKTLWHNFGALGDTVRESLFQTANLSPKIRAEDMSLELWLITTKAYKKYHKSKIV